MPPAARKLNAEHDSSKPKPVCGDLCRFGRADLSLTSVGFSGEIQGGGVEGLPSIRERSFKPSTCLLSASSGALRQSKGRPCEILTHFTGQGKG
jgi:hypothetical protein